MAKTLPPLWLTQLLDNQGALLAGGKIHTYAGGTTTPLATYTDKDAGGTNLNPIILDSAGRADIWLTPNTAYKFVLEASTGAPLETVDGIVSVVQVDDLTTIYEVILSYCATPGAQAWMGGEEFRRSVDFAVDFDGSGGSVITNPGSNYVISVKKNGVEVGTITINSSGVFAFATTGGASVSFISGDTIDFYAPSSVGTAANIKATLVGAL